MSNNLSRRGVIAGGAAMWPTLALAQNAQLATPTSILSNPPRVYGPGAPPNIFPDPDVLVLDRSFGDLRNGQAVIKRLRTGFQWAEGPAWSAEGQYAVFSDVKGDITWRYIWETGTFAPFKQPGYNSNGNTFDFHGRLISCQDYLRRVVRFEHDGTTTIIADNFEGKPLNSPNDLAPHPDGSIWFTDPLYGDQLSEGHPDEGGGGEDQEKIRDPKIGEGQLGIIGSVKSVLPTNVYRWDPSGMLEVVLAPDGQVPNGICFSPDYTKVYFVRGAGLSVADVAGKGIKNLRLFTDCNVDGVHCGPDGMRADKAGNIWSGSTAPLGYAGVTIWNPVGKIIGRIRLPETCANLCFAGPKRDWLFMTAAQSVYMLRVNVQGAAPG
jgi:gluconolactonase